MVTPRGAATALRRIFGARTCAAEVSGPLTAEDDRELSVARTEISRALSNQSASTRASDPQTAASASSTLAGPGWRTDLQAARLDADNCRQNITSAATAATATASPRAEGLVSSL